jgi:hypothetical protein
MMLPAMGTVLGSERTQTDQSATSPAVEGSVVIPCLNEARSLAFYAKLGISRGTYIGDYEQK